MRILLLIAASLPTPAFAQGIYWPGPSTVSGNEERAFRGLEGTSVSAIVSNMLNAFLAIGMVVALAMVLYGAFVLITGRGDEAVKKKSKEHVIWALIGVVVMLFAWSIVRALIGLPLINPV